MHMSDALLSPVVGGAYWVISAGLLGYAAKKITTENDIAKTPLMGIMGAFIFAAQMINFSIPGTGSSGHIGGGLLLACILGPWRAFLTLASVLVVQCCLFADGGLLALGCNIFNLAFFPAFIAYPFIFRNIAGARNHQSRLMVASIGSALLGLEMGAFSVIVQTVLSGNSDLPFVTFLLFMMPIHAAIGIVEGLLTYAVLSFVGKVQPSLLFGTGVTAVAKPLPIMVGCAALVLGGILSYFASEHPDGLEWSIEKTVKESQVQSSHRSPLHATLDALQKKIAPLPDYAFAPAKDNTITSVNRFAPTVSGIAGCTAALLLALLLGMVVRRKQPQPHN